MSDVTLLASQNRDLRNLKIGQQLSWTVNDAGDLQQLTGKFPAAKPAPMTASATASKESKEAQQGEWRNNVISGRVNGSFVSSAGDAGLSRNEINAVIKALQWQLDFRKLRKGDQFSVLMSREHFDGKNRKASCWACVCAPAAKITMRSAPKTANSTIAGALARRAASCVSRP